MDPHANIREQRELAEKIVGAGRSASATDIERLAELVLALDEWRLNGGFDPYAAPVN